MAKRDLALDLFKSYKTGFIKKRKVVQERTHTPGDPELINETLSSLISERDWHSGLAEGNLFTSWPSVVGADIALHTTPLSLLDGVLLIQCSSTAWATQLIAMGETFVAQIQSSAPGALVESVRCIGPQGRSWKKGLRTIKNERGPRDTYG